MTPEQRKRYRSRAVRAQRALAAERVKYGGIDDSSGKRYRVGVFFLLSGELERAVAAFDEFDVTFPDDGGEPIFHLYGALAAYRGGDPAKARARLREAVLGNLFLVPHIIGREFHPPAIWAASNRQEADYLEEIVEFLDEPTSEERRWMAAEWDSATFEKLRKRYIATFGALHGERDFGKRAAILDGWWQWLGKWFGSTS